MIGDDTVEKSSASCVVALQRRELGNEVWAREVVEIVDFQHRADLRVSVIKSLECRMAASAWDGKSCSAGMSCSSSASQSRFLIEGIDDE